MDKVKNLLLLPGLLCDRELWRAPIEALSGLAEISVVDMTGHTDMEQLASSILDTAPAEFALAGFSMGGYCALDIMRQAPHRVERLALIDTSARDDDEPHRQRREMLINLCMQSGIEAVLDRLLPLFVNESSATNPELVDRIRKMARRIGCRKFAQQQQAIMSRRDQRGMLSDIECDTLIVCGEDDELTPPFLHEEMSELITTSKFVTIPDSGHFSLLEQANSVTRVMRNWLAE